MSISEEISPKLIKFHDEAQDSSWSAVERSGILQVISNFNLAYVLLATYRVGIAQKLSDRKPFSPEALLEGISSYLGKHLLKYLLIHGLIQEEEGYLRATQQGLDMFSEPAMAQLGFYVESYGGVTSNISRLLKNEVCYGKDINRDGRSLGEHCATLFKEYHTPTVLAALKGIDAKRILDLGCGGGQFLIDACLKSDDLKGIGLDISEAAIDFARNLAQENGLEERLSFVVGDAFKPDSWTEECFSADVVSAVGVVHEHFRSGEDAVINILNTYAELLENGVKAFILGEPEIRYDLQKSDVDLYLVHIFTAQGYPRYREEWLALFDKTKLVCRNVYTRPDAGPRFNFFELRLR
ncbi:MAG: cyclopropane-fatty-acyl-phospholipid synthase family protein [Microcoleus sp.]